jgi:hypothetical protein
LRSADRRKFISRHRRVSRRRDRPHSRRAAEQRDGFAHSFDHLMGAE